MKLKQVQYNRIQPFSLNRHLCHNTALSTFLIGAIKLKQTKINCNISFNTMLLTVTQNFAGHFASFGKGRTRFEKLFYSNQAFWMLDP